MTSSSDGGTDETDLALEALSLLSKKWHPQIILALQSDGPLGFNELLAELHGISGKVLSTSLDELQEARIVNRTIVSESPLRVEYDVTESGIELECVFDVLVSWGARHLESEKPCLLLADGDRRITELFGHWLEPDYTIMSAHDQAELLDALDSNVEVVVYDRHFPGADIETIVEAARSVDDHCRTIMLTSDRPTIDIVEIDCDAVVRKPADESTIHDAIETQRHRWGESSERREYHALTEKRRVLEDAHSSAVLEASERYAALRDRIEQLADRVGME